MTGRRHVAHSQARLMFKRKSMSKKMFTPGSGGGSKPKRKPMLTLPWLIPQPPPARASIPDDILPFVSPPADETILPAATPAIDRPTYGPENPAPPSYGGPGPAPSGFTLTTVPPSSSDRPKDLPKKESRRSNSHVAVPRDHLQSEAAPDISALDLEHSWSSEFRLRQLRLEHDCELVREVAASLRHEGLFEHFLDDAIASQNAQ